MLTRKFVKVIEDLLGPPQDLGLPLKKPRKKRFPGKAWKSQSSARFQPLGRGLPRWTGWRGCSWRGAGGADLERSPLSDARG